MEIKLMVLMVHIEFNNTTHIATKNDKISNASGPEFAVFNGTSSIALHSSPLVVKGPLLECTIYEVIVSTMD